MAPLGRIPAEVDAYLVVMGWWEGTGAGANMKLNDGPPGLVSARER